jgi:hypothetical protein
MTTFKRNRLTFDPKEKSIDDIEFLQSQQWKQRKLLLPG